MATFSPFPSSNLAIEAEVSPFPKEERTPPVIKINFSLMKPPKMRIVEQGRVSMQVSSADQKTRAIREQAPHGGKDKVFDVNGFFGVLEKKAPGPLARRARLAYLDGVKNEGGKPR